MSFGDISSTPSRQQGLGGEIGNNGEVADKDSLEALRLRLAQFQASCRRHDWFGYLLRIEET